MTKQLLSRRALVRIISYSIAAFAILLASIVSLNGQVKAYQTQIQYSYDQALEDLTSSLETIDTTVKKGIYCNSATQWNEISATLSKASGTAKTALSSLPFSGGELTTINKFLSQVGDYTTSLSRSALAGNSITTQDNENLKLLSETASTLYSAVSEIQNGGADFSNTSLSSAADSVNSFSTTLLETEDSITDYPTLIYDGPFSDNLLNADPKLLQGLTEVTREGARQVAALYLGESTSDILDDGEEDSTMASYCFATDNATISITKTGGYCSYFRKYRDIGEATITYEEAIQIAGEYLERLDLGTFRDSYYISDEGLCVINFAYCEGDVMCYPDLIKVGVALDTGEILLFEGRGYIMNHTQRTIPTVTTTAEQAASVLNPSLTVKSSSLAIIPTDGGDEKFCYEFVCESDTDHVIVYVNAQTLQEEDILILLMVDGGILTK